MKKICLITSITIFSGAGWWLGEKVGMMTGYWVSLVGSLVGVYVGVRINQTFLG